MIPSDQPVTIAPTQSKTYDSLWIYNLSFHAPATNSGNMKAEFLPYNAQSKEIGPSEYLQTVSTDKLWEAVEAVPEVRDAFNAIIAAVGPLKAWVKSQQETNKT